MHTTSHIDLFLVRPDGGRRGITRIVGRRDQPSSTTPAPGRATTPVCSRWVTSRYAMPTPMASRCWGPSGLKGSVSSAHGPSGAASPRPAGSTPARRAPRDRTVDAGSARSADCRDAVTTVARRLPRSSYPHGSRPRVEPSRRRPPHVGGPRHRHPVQRVAAQLPLRAYDKAGPSPSLVGPGGPGRRRPGYPGTSWCREGYPRYT